MIYKVKDFRLNKNTVKNPTKILYLIPPKICWYHTSSWHFVDVKEETKVGDSSFFLNDKLLENY